MPGLHGGTHPAQQFPSRGVNNPKLFPNGVVHPFISLFRTKTMSSCRATGKSLIHASSAKVDLLLLAPAIEPGEQTHTANLNHAQ